MQSSLHLRILISSGIPFLFDILQEREKTPRGKKSCQVNLWPAEGQVARAGQCMKEPALGCQRTHETARDPERELQKKKSQEKEGLLVGEARPGPLPQVPLWGGRGGQEGPGAKELAV